MATISLIEQEIQTYKAIQAQVSGKIINELGFAVYCAKGVMPPNNRVTRCFGAVVKLLDAKYILDLGCGSGILSLVASQKCREVTGIDNDIRSITCARYNASLNQIKNVRFLLGDGFSPLEQQKFDTIISNPPFYPVTKTTLPPASMCIDSSNALLYTLIQDAPQYLNPGGRVLFVTSSFSDNDYVRELLQLHKLDFQCRLLHHGKGSSQDIYLWEAKVSDVRQ